MQKIPSSISLMLCFAVAISACGGSRSPSTSISVEFTEHRFTPDRFTVPAGKEITISATNKGAVEHEFVIFKLGKTAGDKFGDDDEENIYWEVEVLPGETQTAKFNAPTEAGEYSLTCGIEGHLEAGMNGKLLVVN